MLGEIIEEILLIQNVRIDRSVSYADKRERVTFSLMKILQEEKVVSAIQPFHPTPDQPVFVSPLTSGYLR